MKKPTKAEAESAVKTLLDYIGEDTKREGLRDTPSRVVKSYNELFSGYDADISDVLNKRFCDINEYEDVVMLKDIEFTSICEHHMLPFYGSVDIAYIPNLEVIGISKLARLVNVFARRLQIQERMTANIAIELQKHLEPIGVAVRVSATHSCITTRGASKGGVVMESTHFTGVYKNEAERRREFFAMLKQN